MSPVFSTVNAPNKDQTIQNHSFFTNLIQKVQNLAVLFLFYVGFYLLASAFLMNFDLSFMPINATTTLTCVLFSTFLTNFLTMA